MIPLIGEVVDRKLVFVIDSLSYNLKEEVAFLDIQEIRIRFRFAREELTLLGSLDCYY